MSERAFASSAAEFHDVTDPALWWTVFGLVAFDVVGVWGCGWTFVWSSVAHVGIALVLLLGIGETYRRTWRSLALARFTYAIALSIALAFVCQIATYVVSAIAGPLRTLSYVGWDAGLGFRWQLWTAWLHSHPALEDVFAVIYPLHFAASAIAVSVLALNTSRGATRYLRAFALAFLTSAVALLTAPALTNKTNSRSNALVLAIRNGRLGRVDLAHTDGLITFPSMHAVLALLVCLALWQYRRWRVPLMFFTILMLVATVSEGGHYLVDVLGGAALGALVWWAAGKSLASGLQHR
jgi:membrane-associated phospholipid phosphatase